MLSLVHVFEAFAEVVSKATDWKSALKKAIPERQQCHTSDLKNSKEGDEGDVK